jgi:hypothetical protein
MQKEGETSEDFGFTPYQSLQREHPDISYWKSEDICLILSKGLGQTCREQPRNPIEYFANWLLEYNQVQKQAKELEVDNEKVSEAISHKAHDDEVAAKRQSLVQRGEDEKTRENDAFW